MLWFPMGMRPHQPSTERGNLIQTNDRGRGQRGQSLPDQQEQGLSLRQQCVCSRGRAEKHGKRQRLFGYAGSLRMNPVASLAQGTLSLSPVRAAVLGPRPTRPGQRGLVYLIHLPEEGTLF